MKVGMRIFEEKEKNLRNIIAEKDEELKKKPKENPEMMQ